MRKRKVTTFHFLFLSFVVLCAYPFQNAFSDPNIRSNRTLLDTSQGLGRFVGKIRYKKDGVYYSCSGTLALNAVSVITAQHCLPFDKKNEFIKSTEVYFYPAYSNGRLPEGLSKIRIIDARTAKDSWTNNNWPSDWAVATLEVAPQIDGEEEPYGYAPIASEKDLISTDVWSAGYPWSIDYGLSPYTSVCRSKAIHGQLMLVDCEMEKGDSGGPVVGMTANGEALVAINVANGTGPFKVTLANGSSQIIEAFNVSLMITSIDD